MTICDLCFQQGKISEAPETCVECSADMCHEHGEGEFCSVCLEQERFLAPDAPESKPVAVST